MKGCFCVAHQPASSRCSLTKYSLTWHPIFTTVFLLSGLGDRYHHPRPGLSEIWIHGDVKEPTITCCSLTSVFVWAGAGGGGGCHSTHVEAGEQPMGVSSRPSSLGSRHHTQVVGLGSKSLSAFSSPSGLKIHFLTSGNNPLVYEHSAKNLIFWGTKGFTNSIIS